MSTETPSRICLNYAVISSQLDITQPSVTYSFKSLVIFDIFSILLVCMHSIDIAQHIRSTAFTHVLGHSYESIDCGKFPNTSPLDASTVCSYFHIENALGFDYIFCRQLSNQLSFNVDRNLYF